MKQKLMVCAGLLLSSPLLVAQQAASGFGVPGSTVHLANGNAVQFITVPEGQTCPVRLQAKQGFGNGLVKVRHAPDAQPEPPGQPGQHIHLIVTNPGDPQSAPKVVGATVTAHGLTARPRMKNASGASGPADVRRTVNVKFAPASDHSLSTELVLPGFTAVKSIKIEALEYADGSTRDLAGLKVCTVTPDPLMLVAER